MAEERLFYEANIGISKGIEPRDEKSESVRFFDVKTNMPEWLKGQFHLLAMMKAEERANKTNIDDVMVHYRVELYEEIR